MADDNVIDIGTGQPVAHIAGPCVCLECTYRWVGVAEVGDTILQCPSCKTYKGVREGPVLPEFSWHCNCGSFLFSLTRDGPICIKCGANHTNYQRQMIEDET